MSSKCLTLVTGYIRNCIQGPRIITDIMKIICLFFQIIEKFTEYDEDLVLDQQAETIHYSVHFHKQQFFHQKSAFGSISIPLHDGQEEKKISWRISFSILKISAYPLFVGITNFTSFKFCGPHKASIKHTPLSGYLGYALSFYNKLWCQRYFAIDGTRDSKQRYERLRNEIDSMSEDDDEYGMPMNFDDELQFGEILFEVKMKDSWIQTNIKVFKHPDTAVNGRIEYQNCQWQHVYTVQNLGDWFLSVSLPEGGTAQIVNLEIDNDLPFKVRPSIKTEPLPAEINDLI